MAAARTPVIGLTCGKVNQVGSPDRIGVDPKYTQALEAAGAECFLLPPGRRTPAAIAALLDRLDGVLIPGGADVDPRFYGAKRSATVTYTDPERDEYEIRVIRAAVKRGMPVLGICRGQQSINVALGGTLYQDIEADGAGSLKHQSPRGPRHNSLVHSVDVEPGSRYRRATGAARIKVNSRHHQSVRDVAPGLQVTARSSDGVIEGIESPDGRVVAVQCHPEALTRLDWAGRLFRDFVAAARKGSS
jgi:putative glutamine amidotransferase